jgi:hypothetical protein
LTDFAVKITGFRTQAQAEEFIAWYGNSGEQDFNTHLEMNGASWEDGCNINFSHGIKQEENTLIATLDSAQDV